MPTRQDGVENRHKVYSETTQHTHTKPCKTFYSLEENSFCHVTMDFSKQWFFKYSKKKKNEEIDMYDFTVNDCTKKQNGSP